MKANFKVILPLLVAIFITADTQAMRWYSASTGRWLSRDPIGEPGFDPAALNRRALEDARDDELYSALMQRTRHLNRNNAAMLMNWVDEEIKHGTLGKIAVAERPNLVDVVFDPSQDTYTFVNNNPITFIDYNGLAAWRTKCDGLQWRTCSLRCMRDLQIVGDCWTITFTKWYPRPPPGHLVTTHILTICWCAGCPGT